MSNLDSVPIPTPLKPDRLEYWLNGYDTETTKFLVQRFTNGFKVGFSGKTNSDIPKNLKSAMEFPDSVDKLVEKELLAGRIAGPFSKPPFKEFQCSPIGLVLKKDGVNFRLIHHLSFPEGSSINEQIDREWASVTYATIEDAVNLVSATCHQAFMAKTDVKNAFRTVPLHPSVRNLFLFHWKDKFYVDLALPMGCSSSCFIFETLSTAVNWIAEKKLNIPMIHILDDFFLASVSKPIGSLQLNSFLELCLDIGLPMAPDKTFGPDNVLSFVGFEIDTIKQEIRLPFEKIEKMREKIQEFMARDKVTLREMQSLLGLLNFACRVVLPGRPFLRRLIDLTIGIKKPKHFIRLTRQAKADLVMWQKFLSSFNGKVFFLERALPAHDIGLFIDASGKIGYGAVLGNAWFQGRWSGWWLQQNITLLELYPIVLAIETWGEILRNKRLILHTDNLALVGVLSNQTSKEPLVMILVRRLVLRCLHYNIVLNAKHVEGKLNILCDALSRFQMRRFWEHAPGADKLPTAIPQLPQQLG